MSLGGRRGRVNIVFVRYEGRPVKKHDFQVSLNAVCRHTLRHESHTVYSVDGSIDDRTHGCSSSHGLLTTVMPYLGSSNSLAASVLPRQRACLHI